MPSPQLEPLRATVPVRLTVVESAACHFCADAQAVLAELADHFPLVVETIDVRSEAGQVLVARHRAAMSPLVLLDGAFFSNGRLPRRKLAKLLAARYGAPGVVDKTAGSGRRG